VKNKGFRNKDPRYLEKITRFKRQLKRFFIREEVKKHGKKLK